MTPMPANITHADLPPYKAVLWDMDGTLVHSDPVHAACVQRLGDEMDRPVSSDLVWRALGVSHRYAYDLLTQELGALPLSFDAWVAREAELYIDAVAGISARDNVIDVVRALNKRGVKQAIFSNNPRPFIDATIKGFLRFFDNPSNIFSTVISLDDVPAKPMPDGYLLAAARLGLEPADCLVIEDSPTGAAAGIASGCFTIYWPGVHNKPLVGRPGLTVTNLDFLL